MSRLSLIVALFGILALLLVPREGTLAQHEHQSTSRTSMDTSSQGGMMKSDDMMKQMQEHRRDCQQISSSAETTLTDIRSAKKSNDPKVLRAALEKAEKSLSHIRNHTANCMKMMDKMQGSGMMQRGGRMMEQKGMRDTMMMDRPGMRDTMRDMPMDMPVDTSLMKK